MWKSTIFITLSGANSLDILYHIQGATLDEVKSVQGVHPEQCDFFEAKKYYPG